MIAPCSIYLAAYTAVSDEQLYESQWQRINGLIEENSFDETVKNQILKIFGDIDDKIQLDEVYNSLRTLDNQSIEEALSLSIITAISKGHISQKEDKFLRTAAALIGYNHYSELSEKIINSVSIKDDIIEIIPQKHGAVLYQLLSRITPSRLSDKLLDQYKRCLLSGENYSSTITSMRIIAKEDILIARNNIEKVIEDLSDASSKLDALSTNIKTRSGKFNGFKFRK